MVIINETEGTADNKAGVDYAPNFKNSTLNSGGATEGEKSQTCVSL